MLILTRSDVSRIFTMDLAVRAAEEALRWTASGQALSPPRHQLAVSDPHGELLVMPGVVCDRMFGTKIWYRYDDGSLLTDSTSASILTIDGSQGVEAVLDAGLITDYRTGALTAVAARYLAKPSAAVLCVIGAGLQAHTQALALGCTLPSLSEIRIVSRTRAKAEILAEKLGEALRETGKTIRAVPDLATAIDGADIIIAATTSTTPVVPDGAIAPGALVGSVGSHDPTASEIEAATVARSDRVVVDSVAAIGGSGDIAIPLRSGLIQEADIVQLGTVVLNEGPVRQSDGSVTVFKSVGFAAADIVAASLIVKQALDDGIGTSVQLHH